MEFKGLGAVLGSLIKDYLTSLRFLFSSRSAPVSISFLILVLILVKFTQGLTAPFLLLALLVIGIRFLGDLFCEWFQSHSRQAFFKATDFLTQSVSVINQDQSTTHPSKEVALGSKIRLQPGSKLPFDAKLIFPALIEGKNFFGSPINLKAGDFVYQGAHFNEVIELEVLNKTQDSLITLQANEIILLLDKKQSAQSFEIVFRWVQLVAMTAVLFYYGWKGSPYENGLAYFVLVGISFAPETFSKLVEAFKYQLIISQFKSGVAIKENAVLDKILSITLAAFDRTGTLSNEIAIVSKIRGIEPYSHQQLLLLAASAEQKSNHFLAKAIVKEAEAQKQNLLSLQNFQEVSGKGVKAVLKEGSKSLEVAVGNLVWLLECGAESSQIPPSLQWEAEGATMTAVWLSVDKKIVGLLLLSDDLKEDSKNLVDIMSPLKWSVGLITGDSQMVAQSTAKVLKMSFYHYGILPEEKAQLIQRLMLPRKEALDYVHPKVFFIGQDANNEGAFKEATLSLSMNPSSRLGSMQLLQDKIYAAVDAMKAIKNTALRLRESHMFYIFYITVMLLISTGISYQFYGLKMGLLMAALVSVLVQIFLRILVLSRIGH